MRANRPVVLGVLGPLVIGASSLGAVACSSTGTSSSASSTAAPATTAGAPSTGAPGTSAPTSATSRPASALPSSTGSTSTARRSGQCDRRLRVRAETVTVKVGDTVTWTNQDGFDHWVLSEDESTLDSQALVPGQSYATTVTQPGTIAYYCNIHNGMKGTVITI
jgi:plastocyanin